MKSIRTRIIEQTKDNVLYFQRQLALWIETLLIEIVAIIPNGYFPLIPFHNTFSPCTIVSQYSICSSSYNKIHYQSKHSGFQLKAPDAKKLFTKNENICILFVVDRNTIFIQ